MTTKQIDPMLRIVRLYDKDSRIAWAWTAPDEDGIPTEHYYFPSQWQFLHGAGDVVKMEATKQTVKSLHGFKLFVEEELQKMGLSASGARYVRAPQIESPWPPKTKVFEGESSRKPLIIE